MDRSDKPFLLRIFVFNGAQQVLQKGQVGQRKYVYLIVYIKAQWILSGPILRSLILCVVQLNACVLAVSLRPAEFGFRQGSNT